MRNVLILASLMLAVGGCQVAALVDKLLEPREPAKYVPPQQTMLIVVEDYQNPAMLEVVGDHMERIIAEELIVNKVAPIVNPDHLTTLRSDHPRQYKQMKIANIGAKLDAKQILYVNVTDMRSESVGGTLAMKGHAEAQVRVVDSRTGQTLWPADATSDGYIVTVDLPFGQESDKDNDSTI